MMVGYVALCALQGITLERLEIQTEGDIDLRGFFWLGQQHTGRLQKPQLYRKDQGQWQQGTVRQNPRDGDGDVAQLL